MRLRCSKCRKNLDITDPKKDGYEQRGDREVVIVQCPHCGNKFEGVTRAVEEKQ